MEQGSSTRSRRAPQPGEGCNRRARPELSSRPAECANARRGALPAHLARADLIYVGAISDHPQIQLFGKKGMTSLADLRNKVIVVGGNQGTSKLVEPGVIVSRGFSRSDPNVIKAYLMSLYDGVKRAVDDPAYAKQVESKAAKISDPKVLDRDYELGLKLWNRNMAIDPADIQLVLDTLTDPKAKAAKATDFFDNSLIDAVNREYLGDASRERG